MLKNTLATMKHLGFALAVINFPAKTPVTTLIAILIYYIFFIRKDKNFYVAACLNSLALLTPMLFELFLWVTNRAEYNVHFYSLVGAIFWAGITMISIGLNALSLASKSTQVDGVSLQILFGLFFVEAIFHLEKRSWEIMPFSGILLWTSILLYSYLNMPRAKSLLSIFYFIMVVRISRVTWMLFYPANDTAELEVDNFTILMTLSYFGSLIFMSFIHAISFGKIVNLKKMFSTRSLTFITQKLMVFFGVRRIYNPIRTKLRFYIFSIFLCRLTFIATYIYGIFHDESGRFWLWVFLLIVALFHTEAHRFMRTIAAICYGCFSIGFSGVIVIFAHQAYSPENASIVFVAMVGIMFFLPHLVTGYMLLHPPRLLSTFFYLRATKEN